MPLMTRPRADLTTNASDEVIALLNGVGECLVAQLCRTEIIQ